MDHLLLIKSKGLWLAGLRRGFCGEGLIMDRCVCGGVGVAADARIHLALGQSVSIQLKR